MKANHIPVVDDAGKCVCLVCGENFNIWQELSGAQFAIIPIPATCGPIRTEKADA